MAFATQSQTYKHIHSAWPKRREEGATASSFDEEQIAHTLFRPTWVPRLPVVPAVGVLCKWMFHFRTEKHAHVRAAELPQLEGKTLGARVHEGCGQDACRAASGVGFGLTRNRTATMPSSYRMTIGTSSRHIEVMSGGVIAAATAAATTIA